MRCPSSWIIEKWSDWGQTLGCWWVILGLGISVFLIFTSQNSTNGLEDKNRRRCYLCTGSWLATNAPAVDAKKFLSAVQLHTKKEHWSFLRSLFNPYIFDWGLCRCDSAWSSCLHPGSLSPSCIPEQMAGFSEIPRPHIYISLLQIFVIVAHLQIHWNARTFLHCYHID